VLNTAMTGYEEILTVLVCRQIITFTFPHIRQCRTNEDDIETVNIARAVRRAGVNPAHRITSVERSSTGAPRPW